MKRSVNRRIKKRFARKITISNSVPRLVLAKMFAVCVCRSDRPFYLFFVLKSERLSIGLSRQDWTSTWCLFGGLSAQCKHWRKLSFTKPPRNVPFADQPQPKRRRFGGCRQSQSVKRACPIPAGPSPYDFSTSSLRSPSR